MPEMSIRFQKESWVRCWPEIKVTAQDHYAEVGETEGAVNVEALSAQENSGKLVCFTVRDGEKLVGYWWGQMFNSELLGGSLCAFNQALYVNQVFRGTGIGKMLNEFVEASLRQMGVVRVYVGSRSHKSIVPILTHLGYEESEVILEKKL
jgi:GNAT superfamily N-acetyltransferase